MSVSDARSIVLWNKTVIVIDGINGDYTIKVEATDSEGVAYALAMMETRKSEGRGLAVSSIYGCRNMSAGFASSVSMAHQFDRNNLTEALEHVVSSIVEDIQRGGVRLDA